LQKVAEVVNLAANQYLTTWGFEKVVFQMPLVRKALSCYRQLKSTRIFKRTMHIAASILKNPGKQGLLVTNASSQPLVFSAKADGKRVVQWGELLF
jgi:hypothetical protein